MLAGLSPRAATTRGWPLSGPVEADETRMGGKRKNMSKLKRKQIKGSGSLGKTDECSGRHNLRELDTIDQMRAMVMAAVGRRLMYRDGLTARDDFCHGLLNGLCQSAQKKIKGNFLTIASLRHSSFQV